LIEDFGKTMISSAEEFVELRRSERQEEYLRAAQESAPREVWLEVIRCFPDMRFWVAQNKTVPVEVLAVLAHDPDSRVRSMVAMKNKLTDDLFMLLATDQDDSVRASLAHNKKVPSEILERLSRDQSQVVSAAARERLDQS
jgi:hypothetical protein